MFKNGPERWMFSKYASLFISINHSYLLIIFWWQPNAKFVSKGEKAKNSVFLDLILCGFYFFSSSCSYNFPSFSGDGPPLTAEEQVSNKKFRENKFKMGQNKTTFPRPEGPINFGGKFFEIRV